jgi:hypothetical protein
MWAGKWTEAGQFMERAVADALDNQEDVCQLSWIHSAACAYLEAQNFKAARQAYKRGSRELAYQRLGMKHLASLFETNAELILKWSDTQTSSELMKEWRSRFLSGLIETTTFKVAVIGNYPEHGAGSLIADTLETEGLDSQLLYSETVTSFDELPRECGVVILGGYQAHGVEKLVRPWISHKEYSRMVIMESGAPGFGVIEFNASDRVGVWIGSGHHRDTVSATRHWLESGGVQRFIERLRKTTRQVANQQCLTQQDPLQGSRES